MQNQQPEALVLASLFERCVIAFGETETSSRAIAAKELRRLHTRVEELEAMLDAVGAGGVSAQRVTQGKDHTEQQVRELLATGSQPQADARDAGRWGSEPVTGTPFLQEEDQHLLDRFIETTEDNEGFDIGKEAIKRLANLGVVESLGFGRYGVTVFGYWVHEHYLYQNPSLPLKTNLDRDADARAAIAAAKESR